MGFNDSDAAKLLVQCHRRCCICHRFCGVKMELDHIQPRAEGGSDEIENAIPVCFNCHAEIHAYNNAHPRGRKYRPNELRLHKTRWLGICSSKPGELIDGLGPQDVGPLQALIDELEFNSAISDVAESTHRTCRFECTQFTRAIAEGALSLLTDEVRVAIHETYAALRRTNEFLNMSESQKAYEWVSLHSDAWKAASAANEPINKTKSLLLKCIQGE